MPNQLTRVSFTGADDQTPIETLGQLSLDYPFVEWGILYHPEREGQARAPGASWRYTFDCCRAAWAKEGRKVHTALHLCGEQVFQHILEGKRFSEFFWYDRIQVNINARKQIFSEDEVHRVYRTLVRETGKPIIVQYHGDSAATIESWMSNARPTEVVKTDIFIDASRGLGKTPDVWSWPMHYNDRELGFAGGIGPHNVAEVLMQLDRRTFDYGIDMESGVRSDNVFNISKVHHVLEQALPFLKTTA